LSLADYLVLQKMAEKTDYPHFPECKFASELIATAAKICTPGKGILAADEGPSTIGKRLTSIKLENNRANRRELRRLLFTSPGIEKYISGVITYEETLFEKTEDGKKQLIDYLLEKGIVVGIKVDMGTKTLPGTNGETYTQGLTDLDKNCDKYYKQGARFAKWRAVLQISKNTPSQLAIEENANTLAAYASICQDHGLVPIVEPEILMDGKHTIQTCQYWTEKVLAAVYKALNDRHVLLEGTLLKPNMVLTGQDAKVKDSPQAVATATVTALQRTVPPAMPGVVFLSGGQSEEEASVNLNAINNYAGKKPWTLTFSYGRALQKSCIETWQGKPENVEEAQAAFMTRAKANGEASIGRYKGGGGGGGSGGGGGGSGKSGSDASLFESGYKY